MIGRYVFQRVLHSMVASAKPFIAAAVMMATLPQPASAANIFATFTGVVDNSVYYDPYSDPQYTYGDPFTFKVTLRLLFPLDYYEGTPADDYYYESHAYQYYTSDPVLGPLHVFGGRQRYDQPNPVSMTDKPGYSPITYPDPGYASWGTSPTGEAVLGYNSLSFYLSDDEGSYYRIGVTSLDTLFSTIEHLTDIDTAVGPGTGITGTVESVNNYYKEPQYSRSTGYVTHLSVFTLSPVPEPSTWGMLIVGFGAIGMRCRRRRVAVAAC